MSDKIETTYIHIVGGPGLSKSTSAAGIFYALKKAGINSEYITEFAKQLTWSERPKDLSFQPYVAAKQFYKMFQIKDRVEVAVMDTSPLLSLIKRYQGFGCSLEFERFVLNLNSQFGKQIYIYLKRNPEAHPYETAGRSQSEDEAKVLDEEIEHMLSSVLGIAGFYKIAISHNHDTIHECLKIIAKEVPNLAERIKSLDQFNSKLEWYP